MDQSKIIITDLRNNGALVSTIPTIEQMQKANLCKKAEERKKEIESMSREDCMTEMSSNMPMSENIMIAKKSLSKIHPDASFLILGILPKKDYSNITIEDVGDTDKISAALCECMQKDRKYLKLINVTLKYFCRTSTPNEAEECITGLQDIIEDLKKCNDPERQLTLKKAEIKRLRKVGRFDLIKIKEEEITQINAEIEAAKEAKRKEQEQREKEIAAEKRKAELKELRLANLAKGRATLAAKREKAKQQKNNHPQPNFAKMAKAKRQQIAARKAEKKKKKSGASDDTVKSCSQLLK